MSPFASPYVADQTLALDIAPITAVPGARFRNRPRPRAVADADTRRHVASAAHRYGPGLARGFASLPFGELGALIGAKNRDDVYVSRCARCARIRGRRALLGAIGGVSGSLRLRVWLDVASDDGLPFGV